jgi:formyl-CoA transferase
MAVLKDRALQGLRVLDLTQHLSGPYCTMLLGDLGADVVKVEKPSGDDQRRLPPLTNGESAPFMAINRNKKSLTLNLKTQRGRGLLLRLAAQSDILVENFRPGIVNSLGIDYETIHKLKPELVYCSISGYGQTGPYSRKGGFDLMAQGMTGLMDLNSEPGKRPSKIPVYLHDVGAGMTAAYSILAAYIHRLKTGKGQYIDISLVESGLAMTPAEASAFFVNGVVPRVAGTRNLLSTPYQAYRARDAYVIVGASNQKLWETFCETVVERPDWIADPRFATVPDRVNHAQELETLMEEVLQAQDADHWVDKMEAAGVPGGPINSYDQALSDPHFLARGMIQEIDHPKAGRLRTLGIPAKMSETPGEIRLPAPTLGQHTAEILKALLSMQDSDIELLKNDRVI